MVDPIGSITIDLNRDRDQVFGTAPASIMEGDGAVAEGEERREGG